MNGVDPSSEFHRDWGTGLLEGLEDSSDEFRTADLTGESDGLEGGVRFGL